MRTIAEILELSDSTIDLDNCIDQLLEIGQHLGRNNVAWSEEGKRVWQLSEMLVKARAVSKKNGGKSQ